MEPEKLKVKVCLVGDGAVGKTSLLNQFVHKSFSDMYLKTLGTNVSKKVVVGHKNDKEVLVEMMIWDIQGQKNFRKMVKGMVRDSVGALLVCDVTRPESLMNLYGWIALLMEAGAKPYPVFLGNKSDLDAKFGLDELKGVASRFKGPAYLTSAKTGANVEDAFRALADAIATGGQVDVTLEAGLRNIAVSADQIGEAVAIEDKMLLEVCSALGGFEVSIPMVRAMFREWGIDFEHPTPANLHEMAPRFVDLVGWMQSDEAAQKLKGRLEELLAGLA